jgi:tmRNA-binding protein
MSERLDLGDGIALVKYEGGYSVISKNLEFGDFKAGVNLRTSDTKPSIRGDVEIKHTYGDEEGEVVYLDLNLKDMKNFQEFVNAIVDTFKLLEKRFREELKDRIKDDRTSVVM